MERTVMIDAITYALLKGDIGQGTQEAVTEYLDEHLTNPSNPPIDTSLAIAGAAADAKAVGDAFSSIRFYINENGELIEQRGGTV